MRALKLKWEKTAKLKCVHKRERAKSELGDPGARKLATGQPENGVWQTVKTDWRKLTENGDHEDVNPKPCYQLQPKSRSHERAKSDWATVIWTGRGRLLGAGTWCAYCWKPDWRN